MSDSVLTRDGPVSVPMDYQVPQGGELIPRTVRATIDGASAATSFYAVVQVVAPSGRVMFSAITSEIAAGGSADCSWFPWWRGVGAGAPAPSPNPLGTLFAWYDFSDTSTLFIDGSGKISAITDKTGNGHNLGQPTASARPAQSTLNGLNAGLFASANYQALIGTLSSVQTTPYSIAIVWTQTVAGGLTYIPGPFGGSGTGNNPNLFVTNSGTAVALNQGGNSILIGLGSPFTQQCMTGTYNGASSRFRLNGAEQPGTTGSGSLGSIALGAQQYPQRPGLVEAMDGQIGECLIYKPALTTAQFVAVEAYLKAKWATP